LGYTILEDISERKANERVKVETAAQKDEFINILSHELKTPLTTIKAVHQILETVVTEEKSYHVLLRKASHHIERLERLIADLVDTTKLYAGQVVLTTARFNFSQLLQDCVSSAQMIHSKHVISLENPINIRITGDRFRLEQVIGNLIDNAVKYSPGAKALIIKGSFDQKNIKVSVQDFGIGIDDKNIARLFERFYRVDHTTVRFSGMGMGLYIVSEIIKKHAGQFGVDSEIGKGSTFWFSLPRMADDEKAQDEKKIESYRILESFSSRCILSNWDCNHFEQPHA